MKCRSFFTSEPGTFCLQITETLTSSEQPLRALVYAENHNQVSDDRMGLTITLFYSTEVSLVLKSLLGR